MTIYIEQDWKECHQETIDHFQAAVKRFPGLALKIRTGGLNADQVPPSRVLAHLIHMMAEAQISFKFTAGLHAALFETSKRFGFEMHGFANILCAVMLAQAGLETSALEHALTIRSSDALMEYVSDALAMAEKPNQQRVTPRALMHSFGSCSVVEPYDSLLENGFL